LLFTLNLYHRYDQGNRGFLYEIDDCIKSVNNSIESYYNLPRTVGAVQVEVSWTHSLKAPGSTLDT
jgi:hypothetical protein